MIELHDVLDDVYAELVRGAEQAGMPLNDYLLAELRFARRMMQLETAARPGHNAEILARAHARPGKVPPPGWAAQEIRRLRDAASGDL